IVYDPSLGFTTGGGWFYWPGTTDKTDFSFNIKYVGKQQRLQGNVQIMRHMPDGSMYRARSEGLIGLALGQFMEGGQSVGWASFAGMPTYQEPGWTRPAGGYRFILYVEDRNEPGAGYDQFWLELQDGQMIAVPAMSIVRPAVDNTQTLRGGNITVPHRALKR